MDSWLLDVMQERLRWALNFFELRDQRRKAIAIFVYVGMEIGETTINLFVDNA